MILLLGDINMQVLDLLFQLAFMRRESRYLLPTAFKTSLARLPVSDEDGAMYTVCE